MYSDSKMNIRTLARREKHQNLMDILVIIRSEEELK